jgi:hypothetical protein
LGAISIIAQNIMIQSTKNNRPFLDKNVSLVTHSNALQNFNGWRHRRLFLFIHR